MSSHRRSRASGVALIAFASFSTGVSAQQEELKEITVTGSRVITDNLRSPTPVTSVNVDEDRKSVV